MKIAIISGASSGIGREFLLNLNKYIEVDEVWVIARRKNRLAQLYSETYFPIRILPYDLTNLNSISDISNLLNEVKPEICLLINCAGYARLGKYSDISIDDEIKMVDTNISSTIKMIRTCLPYMTSGGGIINVGFYLSNFSLPYLTSFSACKNYILSYSKSLNYELKKDYIRVMCLEPYWVGSEFYNHAFETNKNAIQHIDKIYDPCDVAKKALKDLYKTNKIISIYGIKNRLKLTLYKILPQSLVVKMWLKKQKKPRNYFQK